MKDKRMRARPSWCDVFITGLQNGLSVRRACKQAGISRALVYQRRETDNDFRSAWDDNRSVMLGGNRGSSTRGRVHMRAPKPLMESVRRSSRLLGMSVAEWWRQAAREKLERDRSKKRLPKVGVEGGGPERAEFPVAPVLIEATVEACERHKISMAEWWRRAAREKIESQLGSMDVGSLDVE